jgi:hypothetical protein
VSSNIIAFFDHGQVIPISNDADQLRDAEDKLAAAERRIIELEAERARAIAVSNKPAAAVSKPAKPAGAIDQVTANLSEIVRLAQGVSPEDSRRIRDLVHAASSLLMASTYLPQTDQMKFEAALRNSAKMDK